MYIGCLKIDKNLANCVKSELRIVWSLVSSIDSKVLILLGFKFIFEKSGLLATFNYKMLALKIMYLVRQTISLQYFCLPN